MVGSLLVLLTVKLNIGGSTSCCAVNSALAGGAQLLCNQNGSVFARDDELSRRVTVLLLLSLLLWTVDCTADDLSQMSQSLRAIKRFRVRELTLASSSSKNTRIPPAATAASNLHSPDGSSPPSRSGTGTTPTLNTLNPFVPHKNPESGRWAPPRYSLRRQAVLIKHARASGTSHLLPPGPKMGSPHAHAQAEVTTTLTQSSSPAAAAAAGSSSVFGEGHLGEEEKLKVVQHAEGLVSLRRGGVRVQVQAQAQVQVQELGLGPGQEGQEAAAVKEDEVREAQGEEAPLLAPEQKHNSLRVDAQAVESADWTMPVDWIGAVRERNVAGADVGNRLYAGKKRMFKGHKWERMRERRVRRTKMLLRDMDERIQRFKGVRLFDTIIIPVFFGTGPFFPLPLFFQSSL